MKIVVNDQTFLYFVGYQHIRIVGPQGIILTPQCHEVKGVAPLEFERAQWKKTEASQIRPTEVAAWIKQKGASHEGTNLRQSQE